MADSEGVGWSRRESRKCEWPCPRGWFSGCGVAASSPGSLDRTVAMNSAEKGDRLAGVASGSCTPRHNHDNAQFCGYFWGSAFSDCNLTGLSAANCLSTRVEEFKECSLNKYTRGGGYIAYSTKSFRTQADSLQGMLIVRVSISISICNLTSEAWLPLPNVSVRTQAPRFGKAPA